MIVDVICNKCLKTIYKKDIGIPSLEYFQNMIYSKDYCKDHGDDINGSNGL